MHSYITVTCGAEENVYPTLVVEDPMLRYNFEFQLTWESCGFGTTTPTITPTTTPTPIPTPLPTATPKPHNNGSKDDSYKVPVAVSVTVVIAGALAGLGVWLWKRNHQKRVQPLALQENLLP
jgi:hypothetical protein